VLLFSMTLFFSETNNGEGRNRRSRPDFSVPTTSLDVPKGLSQEDPDLGFAFCKNGTVREVYRFQDTPLFDFDEVRVWFEGNRTSVSYKRHGLLYLGEFCRYVSKSPHQLIDERRKRLRRDPSALLEEERDTFCSPHSTPTSAVLQLS